jgi:molybdopterin-synthase adenylyltransferase
MTTVDLVVPGDLMTAAEASLSRLPEWAGYFLCGVGQRGSSSSLLAREWHPVPDRHVLRGTGHGLSWSPDFDVEMLNRAQHEQLSCVVVHPHGGTTPRLSGTDKTTAASLLPFLSTELPGRPHAFLVLGDAAAFGYVYVDGQEIGTLLKLTVSSSTLYEWWPDPVSALQPASLRFDRLSRAFGSGAAARLQRARVGVVGAGGGGSHVVQQLAYLGVGELSVVDADLVDATSLGRLIGARPAASRRNPLDRIFRRGLSDVGRPKVEVMKRLVAAISPTTNLTAVQEHFPSQAAVAALKNCDIIVACVDRLQVRDDLNRFAKRYLIPLLDIGLEIVPTARGQGLVSAIAGRMTKVLADGPCLRCQGIVDEIKLERERSGQPLGYAGSRQLPDPAVVTLNGVVASIAATEVLQLMTGFAGGTSPNCGWLYDGLSGEVTPANKGRSACAACRLERGGGDVLPYSVAHDG